MEKMECFINGRFRAKIEIVEALEVAIEPAPEKHPPPKTKGNGAAHPKHRGSRINMAVVQALCSGPKTREQLKFALQDANLSPGSLAHGLDSLRKQGTIHNVGPSLWALKNGSVSA